MLRNRYRAAVLTLSIIGVQPAGLPVSHTQARPPARAGSFERAIPDTSALPRYDRQVFLEPEPATSANVSFGDLDGDGHLDIVLAKGRHWPVVDRVLLGDGHGGIRMSYDLGTASDRSYSGRLVDLDGDGDLDVVISNDAPDPKLVYLNDGKGRFQVGSAYGRPDWATRNAGVADVDGDGRPDIIVANRSEKGQANYVCLNRGKGTFDADCLPFARYPVTTITAADVNRDGRVDLVVPHRDGGQSYVYLGAATAGVSDAHRVSFGPPDANIRMAEPADFDGDGVTDIVAIDERTGVAVYLGQRDGGFAPGISLSDGKVVPYAMTVGDLNGDGKPDIVVGHVEAPSTVFFNDGSGRHYAAVAFGDAQGAVYGFAIGDFDEDGTLDIAAARSDARNVLYFGSRGARKAP